MNLVKKERIEYLDVAKGIGIILVCVGHACTNQANIAESPFADIVRFVTLFHMALFFFINGTLYNEKISAKPLQGILKKIKAYYVPFIIYNLIFWVFHDLFFKLHLTSGEIGSQDYPYGNLKNYFVYFIKSLAGFRQRFAGAMWFLESLIVIATVFIIIDYIAKRYFPKRQIIFLTFSVIGIVLINHLFNLAETPFIPYSLSKMIFWGFNGLVFFYLGYMYRVFRWNDKLIKYKVPLSIGFFVILVVTVFCIRPEIISVITSYGLPIYKYGIVAIIGIAEPAGLSLMEYIIYVTVCFAGIIMTILFSQWKHISNCKILKTLGKFSLHIMCLHFLSFKIISFIIIKIYDLPIERLAEYPVVYGVNGLWWIAYTIVGCLVPVLLVMLFEKCKKEIFHVLKIK